MGKEVLLIVFCICCCSSSIAALYLFPFPTSSPSTYDGYSKIPGRVVYNNQDAPSTEDPELCSKDCNIDFTCRGFSSWKQGKGIFAQDYCLKQTSNVNPYLTIPAYVVGKSEANIFVKSS